MTTRKTRPAFQVIADDLRERIAHMRPNERLPTEIALKDEYSVTRTTIRAALKILIEEGKVEKGDKTGYFVRDVKRRTWVLASPDLPHHYADPWRIALGDQQRTWNAVAVGTCSAGRTILSRTLADLLDVPEGTLVARRMAVRAIDGEPADLTTTYIAYDLVKDTSFMFGEEKVDPLALLADAGHAFAGFRDTLATRQPTEAELARMELPQATPVMELRRVVFFRDESERRPLAVVHSLFSALGAEFDYDIQA